MATAKFFPGRLTAIDHDRQLSLKIVPVAGTFEHFGCLDDTTTTAPPSRQIRTKAATALGTFGRFPGRFVAKQAPDRSPCILPTLPFFADYRLLTCTVIHFGVASFTRMRSISAVIVTDALSDGRYTWPGTSRAKPPASC